jgi:hypothetical protein
MSVKPEEWIKLRRWPSPRRTFALKETLPRAEALGQTALATRIRAALAHEETLAAQELRWGNRAQAPKAKSKSATSLDQKIDRTLSSIYGLLQGPIGSLDASHAHHAAAKLIGQRVFPRGVRAITQTAQEVQSELVQAALVLLEGELRPQVETLNLAPYVQQLRALHDEQRPALTPGGEELGGYQDVLDAALAAHRNLCEVVALILALEVPAGADKAQAQRQLLEVIAQQNKEVAQVQRSVFANKAKDGDEA